jgi:hypothetical protein
MKLGGHVMRGIRRCLFVHSTATTADILQWCYRERGRTRRERLHRARAVRGAASKLAIRVGRVWPGGNVWRLRNTEENPR